jgi:putative sterol carrier protein
MTLLEITTPEQLAAQLSGKTDADVNALAAEHGVDAVLDKVFATMLERFLPHRAPSTATTVLWHIDTPAGGRPTSLTAAAGKLTIDKGAAAAPRVTIHASLPVFLRVISGAINGLQAFSDGMLRVHGEQTLALQQQLWFDVDLSGAKLTISTPRELARLVEGRSDDELDAGVSITGVDAALAQVFVGMVDHYLPHKGPRKRTIVEFSVRTKEGDKVLQFVADGGNSSYHVGTKEKPHVTLMMRMPTFLRIVSGKLDGIIALAQGSIKLRGNILTARNVQGWFDVHR